mmetsp:Transcript_17512/g.48854  ORF Transcript_17512/g.48854 Transcript_17512/m.48854 type:complete len:132 (+) Transcript_17512:917-1312(+)
MPTNNHHQCFQHDNSKFQDMAVVPCGNVLKGSANTSGGLGQEQRPPLSTGGLPGSSKIFEALELEMYHIDMKIAGITPAELPPDLACQLMSYHEVCLRALGLLHSSWPLQICYAPWRLVVSCVLAGFAMGS